MSRHISRRSAIQQVAIWGGAAGVATQLLPTNRILGSNDRIGVGMIGVRNQGSGNLKRFQQAGADIVAICDVDSAVAAAATKLVKGPAPKLLSDYRKLLDDPAIDAVVITVPDHWHALMTIHACQAGKDVYCEKPLTLTIAEGRKMVAAARTHQRIVQTGSQQRSSSEFWRACMLVRNGHIGTVAEVRVGLPGCNHPGPLGLDSLPPPELDYERWLGPAPQRPYNSLRVHYNFRFWWDYSGGQMTNFGAHHLDIAQWALGMDDSGPVAVDGVAGFHPERVHEVTESIRLTYAYANGVRLICGQGQKDIQSGIRFIGTRGEIYVNRGKLRTNPEDLTTLPLDDQPVQLYSSHDHTRNFLECMRSRQLPICDVEIGHRSATVCHLGNIVARLGRGVQWDPASETIVGDADAQAMTDRPYRVGY
ncbi:MAG: Gfo/Idh/MocA family oxidoreductase [Pirellulaceae bacterium]|nr:Gfo/Idh/MocA family oxidoreductase [Pirellulaceae bacterium]